MQLFTIWHIGFVLFLGGFAWSCVLVARYISKCDCLRWCIYLILPVLLLSNTTCLKCWQLYVMPTVTSLGCYFVIFEDQPKILGLLASLSWIYVMQCFGFFEI